MRPSRPAFGAGQERSRWCVSSLRVSRMSGAVMAGDYGSGAYASPEGEALTYRVGQSSWGGGWRLLSRGLAKPDWAGLPLQADSMQLDVDRYGGGGVPFGDTDLDDCVEVTWDRLEGLYGDVKLWDGECVPWAVLVPDERTMPDDEPEAVRREKCRRLRRLVFGEAGGTPAAVVSSGVDAMRVEFSPRVGSVGGYLSLAEAKEVVCSRLDAHDVRVAVTPRRDEVGVALLGEIHADFRGERPEAGIGVWPMCWRGLLDKSDFDAAGTAAAAQIRSWRGKWTAARPDFPAPPTLGRLYKFGDADDGVAGGTRLYGMPVGESAAVDRTGLVCGWNDPFDLTERSQALKALADYMESAEFEEYERSMRDVEVGWL